MTDYKTMNNEQKIQDAQSIIDDGNGMLRPLHIVAQFEQKGVNYDHPIGTPLDRNRCCAFCEHLHRPNRFGPYLCNVHRVVFGTVPVSVDGKTVTPDQAVEATITALQLVEEFVCNTHFEPRSW
jgi:hypothetical protein